MIGLYAGKQGSCFQSRGQVEVCASFYQSRWKQIVVGVVAGVAAATCGCRTSHHCVSFERKAPPYDVTAAIQAGIEKHIEHQTKAGGGFFRLAFEGEELELKLVRVHTYYLANLGPRWHFACVDLADIDGDVYDVDFFLEGDPGAMHVTETIVHKRNGHPFYLWGEESDGTWTRSPVEGASKALLGIVEGSDSFEFVYKVTLPQLDTTARMWVPLPSSDSFQTVKIESIDAPGSRQIITDRRYGNKILFLNLSPSDSGKTLEVRCRVDRREKGPYQDPSSKPEEYLDPDRLVPQNEELSEIASQVVAGQKGDLVQARALYDHVIDRMRYMKYGSGWGEGDAVYACDAGTGNCSDFHSYYIALLRAVGIPARFAVGASIPSERNDGGIDGYHCWAEFYAEDKWWPVDLSEADKYAALSTYYFGHHPANRIELSRGRDLLVEPGPATGPINFLAYPVLEVAGKPVAIKPDFSFSRAPGALPVSKILTDRARNRSR